MDAETASDGTFVICVNCSIIIWDNYLKHNCLTVRHIPHYTFGNEIDRTNGKRLSSTYDEEKWYWLTVTDETLIWLSSIR